jgi:hypothetical protein
VVANFGHLSNLKYSKALPYTFTEHGVIMAANVLNTPRAIDVNVFIVRAFVKLRRTISEHKELARKISQLDNRLADHDQQILMLVQAIKQLMNPKPPPKKRRIGFHTDSPIGIGTLIAERSSHKTNHTDQVSGGPRFAIVMTEQGR